MGFWILNWTTASKKTKKLLKKWPLHSTQCKFHFFFKKNISNPAESLQHCQKFTSLSKYLQHWLNWSFLIHFYQSTTTFWYQTAFHNFQTHFICCEIFSSLSQFLKFHALIKSRTKRTFVQLESRRNSEGRTR